MISFMAARRADRRTEAAELQLEVAVLLGERSRAGTELAHWSRLLQRAVLTRQADLVSEVARRLDAMADQMTRQGGAPA